MHNKMLFEVCQPLLAMTSWVLRFWERRNTCVICVGLQLLFKEDLLTMAITMGFFPGIREKKKCISECYFFLAISSDELHLSSLDEYYALSRLKAYEIHRIASSFIFCKNPTVHVVSLADAWNANPLLQFFVLEMLTTRQWIPFLLVCWLQH